MNAHSNLFIYVYIFGRRKFSVLVKLQHESTTRKVIIHLHSPKRRYHAQSHKYSALSHVHCVYILLLFFPLSNVFSHLLYASTMKLVQAYKMRCIQINLLRSILCDNVEHFHVVKVSLAFIFLMNISFSIWLLWKCAL